MKTSNGSDFSTAELKQQPDVNFRYRGKTALSVKGNISGKNYRFSSPGDVQPVDHRDAPSMMAVPVLERLR